MMNEPHGRVKDLTKSVSSTLCNKCLIEVGLSLIVSSWLWFACQDDPPIFATISFLWESHSGYMLAYPKVWEPFNGRQSLSIIICLKILTNMHISLKYFSSKLDLMTNKQLLICSEYPKLSLTGSLTTIEKN